ncbi:hypothetical protein VaNZ11_012170 [Volvox africanus]|uniref:DNA polymerase delta small subunit n=1 Tax=Volvox africanus TaxID=51714 RepID=A0ABQ5SEA2_9CHLO|nr:hypothetical protein VaNZ11_012170 [Volvox africanus]
MLDVEGPQSSHRLTARYDELLAPVTSKDNDPNFYRASAIYTNLDERFCAAKRTYERQYAQLYFSRLMLLKEIMRGRVQQLWPGIPVCSILEVQESMEVAVIGTIYKNMKLKPSILDEYSKDRGLKAALGASNFCSDNDSLVLEDEGARMVLSTPPALAAGTSSSAGADEPLNVQELVTGAVVAVRGVHEAGGDFLVSAVCFPGMAPNPHPPPGPALVSQQTTAVAADAAPGDKYIALASGLCLGGSKVDMLKIQLAFDFLTGNLGSPVEQQLSAQIVRLVIAGGCIGQLEALAGGGVGSGASGNVYNRRAQGAALQPVRDLDLLLAEVSAGMPVDLMPGAEDPANVALPQQPMHRCLLPASGMHRSFVRATNPHEFESDGVRFLGCSGQNIDDMAKYCSIRDRLDLMERMLTYRHMAPTAPDTLTCYPFHDKDPFILETTPHVYFVGNQPEFATRLVAGMSSSSLSAGQLVRLVAVPSFARTGTIVLVNLRTLACHPVRFDASLGL